MRLKKKLAIVFESTISYKAIMEENSQNEF